MPESAEPEALRQTIVDEKHLRMLTLGYHLSAGMCLLFSLSGGCTWPWGSSPGIP